MKIDFIEIQNFRKLHRVRIDFDSKKTLLVGANNSGKTSAIIALQKFLKSSKKLEIRDISVGAWSNINKIGSSWEKGTEPEHILDDSLPKMDIWLDVPLNKIHHIVHILPSIDWNGGAIGVRLQYEIPDINRLKSDYIQKRANALKIEKEAPEGHNPSIKPRHLIDFLDDNLSIYLELKAYSLDPDKKIEPDSKGIATLQELPSDTLEIEDNPFERLIRLRDIPASREFRLSGQTSRENEAIRTLSDHVSDYYKHHIREKDEINEDDIGAFSALQTAERAFDKRLKTGFSSVFEELSELGIPGINNPNIVINTKFTTLDGLNHKSAVQYKISEPENEHDERYLPESFAGLGYQNLIKMVFELMRFREDWIEQKIDKNTEHHVEPLQLVLIEEPEAHLHAQVQQVFIKKAYDILRNHRDLGTSEHYSTQLMVSTHSSHIAHEVDFAHLRYFRRLPPETENHAPVSTVINLAHVFSKDDKEDNETLRFVRRYIKATDCDLFFADGAIFVEGQSERILVPHFIRYHYPELWKRYISVIDLGGSNAPRFKPLLKALGLTSLVITDLDSGKKTDVPKKDGSGMTTRTLKAKPKRADQQITTNPTLKGWHPNIEDIDALLDLIDCDHATYFENEYDLYVAYQKTVNLDSDDNSGEKGIPRTFEDALVLKNQNTLRDISGSATSNKIAKLLKGDKDMHEFESKLYDIVDSAEKASFAIDCLVHIEDATKLMPPEYIDKGLVWFQDKLRETTLTPLDQEG